MRVSNIALVLATGLTLGIGMPTSGRARASGNPELTELVERAAVAHAHLMAGDVARYRKVIEVTPDFTLMDPFGGPPTGAPASAEAWARIGRLFEQGRDSAFELIASYFSRDMAVLVANEHAHVAVAGLPAQTWSLRVTLVFKREHGSWQLAHRHADPLAPGISMQVAATLARGAEK
jgi:ketosteroid isomerase-like protein